MPPSLSSVSFLRGSVTWKRFIRLAQLLRLIKGLLNAFSTNHAREYYMPFLRKQQDDRTACKSVPSMLTLESSLRQTDVAKP